MRNYKRSGKRGKCARCPEQSANAAIIIIGVALIISGAVVLLVVTIKSEGEEDMSDAAKKIIINCKSAHFEHINVRIRLANPRLLIFQKCRRAAGDACERAAIRVASTSGRYVSSV